MEPQAVMMNDSNHLSLLRTPLPSAQKVCRDAIGRTCPSQGLNAKHGSGGVRRGARGAAEEPLSNVTGPVGVVAASGLGGSCHQWTPVGLL